MQTDGEIAFISGTNSQHLTRAHTKPHPSPKVFVPSILKDVLIICVHSSSSAEGGNGQSASLFLPLRQLGRLPFCNSLSHWFSRILPSILSQGCILLCIPISFRHKEVIVHLLLGDVSLYKELCSGRLNEDERRHSSSTCSAGTKVDLSKQTYERM